MHQAVLLEKKSCGEQENVVIKASSAYSSLPLRFKLIGPEQDLVQTACDEAFWLLPLVYLRQLAQHLGSFPHRPCYCFWIRPSVTRACTILTVEQV